VNRDGEMKQRSLGHAADPATLNARFQSATPDAQHSA
jgi:hypothetical protein